MHAPKPLTAYRECVGVGQWNVSLHWYTAMCTFLLLNKSIEQDYIKWTVCPGHLSSRCLKTSRVMLHATINYKLYYHASLLGCSDCVLNCVMLSPWATLLLSPSEKIFHTNKHKKQRDRSSVFILSERHCCTGQWQIKSGNQQWKEREKIFQITTNWYKQKQ